MNKVYIVLSRSNTALAMLVRTFTGKYYNHASIAFEKDLNNFYSFGRKNPRLLFPAGFISEGVHTGYFGLKPHTQLRVLEFEVEEEKYNMLVKNVEGFEKRNRRYRYNILGLPMILCNKPWNRTIHYTCSGFIAYCMRNILDFGKHYSLAQPEDFFKFKHKKIYEGTAGDYHYEK